MSLTWDGLDGDSSGTSCSASLLEEGHVDTLDTMLGRRCSVSLSTRESQYPAKTLPRVSTTVPRLSGLAWTALGSAGFTALLPSATLVFEVSSLDDGTGSESVGRAQGRGL